MPALLKAVGTSLRRIQAAFGEQRWLRWLLYILLLGLAGLFIISALENVLDSSSPLSYRILFPIPIVSSVIVLMSIATVGLGLMLRGITRYLLRQKWRG